MKTPPSTRPSEASAQVPCSAAHVFMRYETDGGWAEGCQTCANAVRRQYAKMKGWRRTLNQMRMIRKYRAAIVAQQPQNSVI